MFIWENVDHLTDNYHSGGGLAVVAATLERARELAPQGSSARTEAPDHVYMLAEPAEERALVFPDAGCC